MWFSNKKHLHIIVERYSEKSDFYCINYCTKTSFNTLTHCFMLDNPQYADRNQPILFESNDTKWLEFAKNLTLESLEKFIKEEDQKWKEYLEQREKTRILFEVNYVSSD